MLTRSTVGEIEDALALARWNRGKALEVVAWQTCYLMAAWGMKPAEETGETSWRAELLLGRDLLPDDPTAFLRGPAAAPVPTAAEQDKAEAEADRVTRARLMLTAATIQAAGAAGHLRIEGEPPS